MAWNIIAVPRRTGGRPTTSWPPIRITPALGSSCPRSCAGWWSCRSRKVPEDSNMCGIRRSMLWTATVGPNCLVTLVSSISPEPGVAPLGFEALPQELPRGDRRRRVHRAPAAALLDERDRGQRERDHDEGDRRRDRADREQRGRGDVGGHVPDLERKVLRGPPSPGGARKLVVGQRETEQRDRDHAGKEDRQHDGPEDREAPRAEVARRLLVGAIERLNTANMIRSPNGSVQVRCAPRAEVYQ